MGENFIHKILIINQKNIHNSNGSYIYSKHVLNANFSHSNIRWMEKIIHP
jgi:hypothetical protein